MAPNAKALATLEGEAWITQQAIRQMIFNPPPTIRAHGWASEYRAKLEETVPVGADPDFINGTRAALDAIFGKPTSDE